MSEDGALEAMDGAEEHVQVNRSRGKSLGQGRKDQLDSWNSSQQLVLEGSSWSSWVEVDCSCQHDGVHQHGDSHDNCLGSCSGNC